MPVTLRVCVSTWKGSRTPAYSVVTASWRKRLIAFTRRLPLERQLAEMAATDWVPARLQEQFKSSAAAWASAGASERMLLSAALLAASRDYLGASTCAAKRLELLDFSLRLEAEHFRAATAVREQLPDMSRAEILQVLAAAGDAAYGVGLLNKRLQNALRDEIASLATQRSMWLPTSAACLISTAFPAGVCRQCGVIFTRLC